MVRHTSLLCPLWRRGRGGFPALPDRERGVLVSASGYVEAAGGLWATSQGHKSVFQLLPRHGGGVAWQCGTQPTESVVGLSNKTDEAGEVDAGNSPHPSSSHLHVYDEIFR